MPTPATGLGGEPPAAGGSGGRAPERLSAEELVLLRQQLLQERGPRGPSPAGWPAPGRGGALEAFLSARGELGLPPGPGDQRRGGGVLPRPPPSSDRDSAGKPDWTEEAPAQASQTKFMTKEDLERMRSEMRESYRTKQRQQAQRREGMETDCPLFLSLRMRRMLEFVLHLPPRDLDAPAAGHALDTISLDEGAAQVIAQLIFHNNVPPSYVQHFIVDASRGGKGAKDIYAEILGRMREQLREDPPTGVDWSCLPDGALRPLTPARVDMQRGRATRYGVEGLSKEEVVMQTGIQERGPPRSWFGNDDDVLSDGYVYRRQINTDLPIGKHKKEICELIKDNQITLIQGETGCGKTTQVPQYILEAALQAKAEQRRAVRIVVTQPRRIAAITVAKRVAEELGEKVGEGVVGYKIRGTTVASPSCKLLFCTTGVVLRRLANEGSKWMFSPKTVTHLLVDEVHERGVETDFMLTFLKEVQSRRPNLRVVLMSATMDTECFLKYFTMPSKVTQPDGAEEGKVIKPSLVVCPAFCHPVSEVYLEGITRRLGKDGPPEGGSPDELRRDPNEISERDGIDYDLIVQAVEEMESSPDGAWTFCVPGATKPKNPQGGAILVFLPGLGEISQLMAKLEESACAPKWWLLPLHANLPPEDQQTCFLTTLPAGCTRKIICATNVAETSVTVPDVTCVIDTCRERRNQVDRHSNTPTLREQWCALDSMKQRRGRAGRVQPGVCFRVVPERYLERFEAVTPPEMQRVPLENVYLQVCASGIIDRPAFLAKTPDPPDENNVLLAEGALKDLGALDEAEHDGLTPLGRHLAALPCHPRLGKILVLGCLLGVPGPCLSICAAMSVRNPMMTTQDTGKRAAWQSARNEIVEQMQVRSDHCVWAHIMHEWRFGDVKQRDYCRKLGLSFERMCSSMFERKHLCESLVQVGMLPSKFLWNEWEEQERVPDWTLVRAAVVGGLYPNIINVARTAPRSYQSMGSSPSDRAKRMRYTFMQKHYSSQPNSDYEKSVNLHPNSLCFGQDQYHCPWLAYYNIQQTTRLYAYDVSEVNPFALLLFGAEPVAQEKLIEVGGWIRFFCPDAERIFPLIRAARSSIQKVLEQKLENVRHDIASSKELKVCVELLKSSGLGYRRPSPPPVLRSRKAKEEGEFDEWENEVSYMMRKDKEHEDKMQEVWSAAKRAAAGQ